MTFITLTHKYQNSTIVVNPSHIITLQKDVEGGTVIEHTTGYVTVKETIDEIRSRINYAVEDRYVPL